MRTQRFPLQCKRKQDQEKTNKRLINFSNLVDSCLSQSFNISLSLARRVPPNKTVSDPFQVWDRDGKRKRDDKRIVDDNQLEGFRMKPEEDGHRDFAVISMSHRPICYRSKCGPKNAITCTK
jgi:hypothetical protein